MTRWSNLDTDEERLPDGMTRAGYDADTQVYTFIDADGSYWQGAPGAEYGTLYPVPGQGATVPRGRGYIHQSQAKTPSWRSEMRPFLNFLVIVGVTLIALVYFIGGWSGHMFAQSAAKQCGEGNSLHEVVKGDTCWQIATSVGMDLDELMRLNQHIVCDRLSIGETLCVAAH